MDELPYAYDGTIAVDAHFRTSLEDAVDLYTSSREEALGLLYKNKELTRAGSVALKLTSRKLLLVADISASHFWILPTR